MKIRFTIFAALIMGSITSAAQEVSDTTKRVTLSTITIEGTIPANSTGVLAPVKGTYIFSGKKSEIIPLAKSDFNVGDKTGRQVFSKIPGVFVYDMDGAGNQMNVSARGLDPHRGWEFNIRKDGVITNSDMYGYPASHYSVPLESVERVELVRGTGSLQYGAQFGGMLNYVSKEGDTTKTISFESINTAGSFKLLSTYNAIGGKIGKVKYYAYVSKRSGDGYRDNEHSEYDAEGAIITYKPSNSFSLRLEYARSNYVYRIPGPLTENMFAADPTQASRSRNYFNPAINIPSLNLKWDIAPKTKLQFVSSAVLGERNSVLFDKASTIADTIVKSTFQYNNRQVDVDHFNSYTNELRVLQQYKLGNQLSSLVAGVQYMNNDLHRTQLGKGTTGSDFDLTLVDPAWGRDLHFKTQNVALFAENSFQLAKQLSVNVGARLEVGESKMSGRIAYYPESKIPVSIKHNFPLFGASMSYKPSGLLEVYGGFSEAYRSMAFKDLIPGSLYELVDPNIKDADGYNAEIGFRGSSKFLKWDFTGFLLQYNNRFGTLVQTDNAGVFYTYRTNIGNSLTKGLEMLIQASWPLSQKSDFSVFTSTSIMDGKFTSGVIRSGNSNVSVKGNKIESAPNVISRNGVTARFGVLSISGLYSYTSESYADVLNTVIAAPSGAVGLVPSYGILDFSSKVKVSQKFEVRAGVNNLTDKQYFTKRPTFYPGPGIWSSYGRNYNFSFVVHI